MKEWTGGQNQTCGLGLREESAGQVDRMVDNRTSPPGPLSEKREGEKSGAISEPVKDWTTRQKTRNWTDFEGETGRTIGQKVGQRAPRAAG